MERLIRKIDGHIVFPSELIGVTVAPDNEIINALLSRVAAYEDTGLEPKKVEILARSYPKMFDMVDELDAYRNIGSIDHFRELVQAEAALAEKGEDNGN